MPRTNDDWLNRAYADCLEPLRKYLRRIVGSAEAAEDLAHDAFLKVFTAPNFDQTRSSQGYLFRTAKNLALDMTRSHSVARTDAVEHVENFVDGRDSVEQEAMTAEEYRVLCKAMSRLTPRQNKVLTLRVFFEYSCPDIADQLRISKATVHREFARAIETVHAARPLVECEMTRHNAPVIALQRDGESTA